MTHFDQGGTEGNMFLSGYSNEREDMDFNGGARYHSQMSSQEPVFVNDNIRSISLQSTVEFIPLSCMEVGKNMSVMSRDMSD